MIDTSHHPADCYVSVSRETDRAPCVLTTNLRGDTVTFTFALETGDVIVIGGERGEVGHVIVRSAAVDAGAPVKAGGRCTLDQGRVSCRVAVIAGQSFTIGADL